MQTFSPVTSGQPARFPAGSHELKADPFAGSPGLLPPRRFEVVANETVRVEVQLPDNVAVCEATVTFPSGRPARTYLTWQQLERRDHHALGPGRGDLVLLPTGTVDLTLVARGCETLNQRVEVGPNDRVTKLAFTVRAAR